MSGETGEAGPAEFAGQARYKGFDFSASWFPLHGIDRETSADPEGDMERAIADAYLGNAELFDKEADAREASGEDPRGEAIQALRIGAGHARDHAQAILRQYQNIPGEAA